MNDRIPESKLKRGMAGGAAAAKVGGGVLQYYASKPFLSQKSKEKAKQKLDEKTAQVIFQCLTLLKGTALKVAQLLSLELELFPPAVQRELAKSYNQMPPINRVMARKSMQNALGKQPQEVFKHFDLTAFAAASLGQVHKAVTKDGKKLAVKLQYPGIQRTIKSDLQLLRGLLKPLPDFKTLAPAINEIEERLLEEIDYGLEARNVGFFAQNLNLEGVNIPELWEPGCSDTTLAATFMEGLPLNEWIKTNPAREERDLVAQRLNDIFVRGLYGLHCIHADPNPGNFIIREDLSVGLVDFGCIKKFEPKFVGLYSKLVGIIVKGDKEEYFAILRKLKFTKPNFDQRAEDDLFAAAYGFGQWLGKIYQSEKYDFTDSGKFINSGRAHMQAMYKHRDQVSVNPQIIFLNRTRYGLLKLFEQMGARVSVRNPYEWDA
jgi:predicted unusual protein kinase regulating ubiquinone biosynthesis (AarF/ABC1/UbiB family)